MDRIEKMLSIAKRIKQDAARSLFLALLYPNHHAVLCFSNGSSTDGAFCSREVAQAYINTAKVHQVVSVEFMQINILPASEYNKGVLSNGE